MGGKWETGCTTSIVKETEEVDRVCTYHLSMDDDDDGEDDDARLRRQRLQTFRRHFRYHPPDESPT